MGKNHQPDVRDFVSSDSSDEKSSPTSAKRCCQHVKRAVDSQKIRKQLRMTGLLMECDQCQKLSFSIRQHGFEYDNTLWLCLKCGSQLCGRARNQHALQHFKTPHSDTHALAINTRTFEIWCYECDTEVQANSQRNLLDCVAYIKTLAQKPPIVNIENKILSTWENLTPLISNEDISTANSQDNKSLPLLPPPPPIPGIAKRVNDAMTYQISSLTKSDNNNRNMYILPRVRGLTNLGNTCFFNAVLQCLAQTPYLLEVLKESSEPGEEFTLPGGIFKSMNEEIVELPPIKGTLTAWGGLTIALAHTLEELQSGGAVFTPSELYTKLCKKCPQFQGGEQHDSHELLRHLLESVRSEDLKRYQRVILQNLGYKDKDSISDDMKKKCKIYGNQAADRILRPDQVFRGFLVSTLKCQECYNVSSRHEYFLDLSLPVSVEKSPPPQLRRKASPDNLNAFLHSAPTTSPNTSPTGQSKTQSKKEQKKERKFKRTSKRHVKLMERQMIEELTGAAGDNLTSEFCNSKRNEDGLHADFSSASSSSVEQSDADIEDNLIDDNEKNQKMFNRDNNNFIDKNIIFSSDSNGNNQLFNSVDKRDDSPENIDKDSLDEDENDSGIATSPANAVSSFPPSSNSNSEETNGETTATNSVMSMGLSEKSVNFVTHLYLDENDSLVNGQLKIDNSVIQSAVEVNDLLNIEMEKRMKSSRGKTKRVRTQSHSDWSTTIAPRYQCEDGECSLQSCLNNFTAVELMTGNNKVGCDNCTKCLNGNDTNAKTVNTNATKQFLISSPPAVLILHLKRFQLGPRCMFRKLPRPVSFPMILDIAPFCGSKVKNLPNIDRKQKKLLYALYGVVEHTGGMYGGHYTAYVKVRPKIAADDQRWKFIPQGSKAELDQDDEQRKKLEELLVREKARELRIKTANDSDDFSNSCSSSTDSTNTTSDNEKTPRNASYDDCEGGATGGFDEAIGVQMPIGRWYHVSDSFVREASESAVLGAQAYLLFYERIY